MSREEIETAIAQASKAFVREVEHESPPAEAGMLYNVWDCPLCGFSVRYRNPDRKVAVNTAKGHVRLHHNRSLDSAGFEAGETRRLTRPRN